MSSPVQLIPTAVGEFQALFGALPGAQDAKAECEKWERLCAELLAERERLRAELTKEKVRREKLVLDAMCKDFKLDLTMDEVYAQVARDTPIEQLLAELEAGLDK